MAEKLLSEMSEAELRDALEKARSELSGLNSQFDDLEYEKDVLEERFGQVVERPLFDRAIGLLTEIWKQDGGDGAALPESGDDLRRRVRDLLIDEGKI